MSSVAVIDGFAEGWQTSKIFREAIERAGYQVTKEAGTADVIVAHSAGCFFLPDTHKGQLVFLVGPPYWPGRPVLVSLVQKLWRDFVYRKREGRLGYWAKKHLWSLLYILTDIPHTIKLTFFVRHHDFRSRLQHTDFILVRNRDDSFCTPDIESIPFGNKKIGYHELPGEHDDLWANPGPYVKLIAKHLDF